MSTIKAVLKADRDGTLHLPLPPELQNVNIEVTATLKPANGKESSGTPRFGCLAGKIVMTDDFDEPLDDFKEYTE